MADVGSIGNYRLGAQMIPLDVWAASGEAASPMPALLRSYVRRQNIWRYDNKLGLAFSSDGIISGAVYEDATPIAYAIVRLYFSENGVFVGGARTAADGTFTIDGLPTEDTAAYYAIAFDPDGGVQYNALIFDRLTPSSP